MIISSFYVSFGFAEAILHSSFKKLLAVLNKEPMLGLGRELTPSEVEDRSVGTMNGLRC